jgi:hypothetical protein
MFFQNFITNPLPSKISLSVVSHNLIIGDLLPFHPLHSVKLGIGSRCVHMSKILVNSVLHPIKSLLIFFEFIFHLIDALLENKLHLIIGLRLNFSSWLMSWRNVSCDCAKAVSIYPKLFYTLRIRWKYAHCKLSRNSSGIFL